MSFNLNKLVQPECGGSNPLVSAAQQISMRPSTSSVVAAGQLIRPSPISSNQVNVANFSREFMQMKLNPNQLANPQTHQQTSHKSALSINLSKQATNIHAPNNHVNPLLYQQGAAIRNQSVIPTADLKTNGLDQLEAKYRSDILAQQRDESVHQEKSTADEEFIHRGGGVDDKGDVEFWRDLAQRYIGPLTNDDSQLDTEDDYISALAGDIKFPSDLEYTFDERNPFKDQFEDPFAEGLKRLEMGDIPSAALLFEAAVQKDPKHVEAWRYLGTTNAQNEMDRCAIRALNNCLELDPADQEARLACAVSLANENRRFLACQQLIQWLANNAKYQGIAADHSQFEKYASDLQDDIWFTNPVSSQHFDYTLKKFLEAANMSPNNPDPDVQCSLGVLFNLKGEYMKAVDCFKAALSVKSDDSKLWNRLGATLANGNKNDEAIVAYRKALDLSPGFLRSRYNLAISLIHMSLYDEAGKQLVQVLNMQAAGKDKFSSHSASGSATIRARSITSNSIWETLRTVSTLMNRPDLYPIIESRNLDQCNKEILNKNADRPFMADKSAESPPESSD